MARHFGGADSIASASNSTINFNRANTFTMAIWSNPSVAQGGIVGHLDPTGNLFNGWELSFGSGGVQNLFLINNINAGNTLDIQKRSATNLTSSVWQHVGFSYSGNGLASGCNIYLNGVNDNGTTITDNLQSNSITSNKVLFVGSRADGTLPSTGSMADLGIWNVVLTAAEFLALANGARPYTIRPSGLVLYYPLDGIQSPEPDLSGNANNGTLTATTLAAGPPIMMFTPRWPQFLTPAAAGAAFKAQFALGKNVVIEGVAT